MVVSSRGGGAGDLVGGAGDSGGVGDLGGVGDSGGVGDLGGAGDSGGVGDLGGVRGCCCRGEEKWKQDGYHVFSSSYTKLLNSILRK